VLAIALGLLRAGVLALEELGHALLQFLLPLRDLYGVDLIAGSDLVDGLDALESLEGDARLELGAVGSSFLTQLEAWCLPWRRVPS